MLRIFGTINSRTARTIWMAEELGVPNLARKRADSPIAPRDLVLAGRGPMAGLPGRADDEPAAPQPYLIGQRFTVADLNVAAVLDWVRAAPDLLKAYPGVSAWLQRCFARDAYGRVRAMRRVAA